MTARVARLARHAFARAAYVAALCVLLVGVVRGGAAYFHCGMMNAYLAAPCCDAGHGHEGEGVESEPEQGAALREEPCCSGARLSHLPASAPGADAHAAVAPLAAEPPATRHVEAPAEPLALAPRSVQSARDGPPSASRRRALLNVYVL
ncbi:MAG: hypothetical protein IPF92_28225 [Myxococcales bacterium]|nr:hypothetical protein [Myxococcales bacterium]MBL0196390.1 hypothetical protein [Myxococcales bacterium]HQY60948.1 hypothetical protein [Polyangiaceae bacterium]